MGVNNGYRGLKSVPVNVLGCYICRDYLTGVLQKHKWENAMTIDRQSWGYRREAVLEDYLSIEELLQQLAITVR